MSIRRLKHTHGRRGQGHRLLGPARHCDASAARVPLSARLGDLDCAAWYAWYTEAVASGRIAVANGRIFLLKPADPRPFPSVWVRLRPFSTRVAEGSIPGASTLRVRGTTRLRLRPEAHLIALMSSSPAPSDVRDVPRRRVPSIRESWAQGHATSSLRAAARSSRPPLLRSLARPHTFRAPFGSPSSEEKAGGRALRGRSTEGGRA
jgi:hypothetical protein